MRTVRFAASMGIGLIAFKGISGAGHGYSGTGNVVLADSGSAAAEGNSVELEQVLFVQAPAVNREKGGIHLLWIPAPLIKYCLGKTAQQCSTIDYCIRTTDKSASMCKNIGVDVTRVPPYPQGTQPRRLLSVVYFPLAPINGFDKLKGFYQSAPTSSLEHISMSARIKARIRFTRTADDDDFDMLEVVAVPPL
jgi:hypothetical protein